MSLFSRPRSARLKAIIRPVIFGSTVVLAKLGLAELGPLTLTTLWFVLAALVLLPLALHRQDVSDWSRGLWRHLVVMGISFCVIGNGSLFLGLPFIPATTVALLLSLTRLSASSNRDQQLVPGFSRLLRQSRILDGRDVAWITVLGDRFATAGPAPRELAVYA